MMVPSYALAQDEADTEDEVIEEIITTGYRSSLMNSINTKRNASSIVEAISAEDIGKLPDASIGESLARLPGLAAQRFDGRANKISIRGLAPDFTTTMLNGRELVSSDNNRAVEYDQFPSELITGATVYKTPDASLTAQAIGGTVDMLTVRPLNYAEPILAVGLRGEYADEGKLNSDTEDTGYRGNIAVVGQNDDGTVGWAFGYSRMFQPIQEEYVHVWGYSDVTDGDGDQGLYIDGIKPFVKSNELTRDGVLGVVEFAPTDELHARVDMFYSKFDDEQTLRGAEIAGYTAADRDILSVGSDGLAQQGTWTGLRTQTRNDFSDRDVETKALGFNLVYTVGDWEYEGDVSWSDSERDYSAHEVYLSQGRGQTGPSHTYTYTLGGDNGLSVATDANFADGSWELGDNLGWGGPLCTEALGWQCDSQDGFRNTETSTDDLTAIKLAAEKIIDDEWITSVEFGMRYSERNKGHTRVGSFLTLNDYPNTVAIPSSLQVSNTGLDFLGVGDIVSFNARAAVNSGLYYYSPENLVAAAVNTWSIEENVANFYIMANFETDDWSGNFGVQAVYTDQASTGTQAGDPTATGVEYFETTQGTDFWEALPSFNASYHINDDMKLRMGLARILARPRMEDMRASSEFTFNDLNLTSTDPFSSPWGGSGGNPYLEPWMAWQLDFSLETYFGNSGYAALSVFHKELENYVFNQSVVVDFSAVELPEPLASQLGQTTGPVSAPANGEGGWIRGVELSASIPFDLFSDSLRNFGAYVSASYTDSEVQETPSSPKLELPGLSKTVLNGTFYYENEAGFQARVSARTRDDFLAESFAIGLSRQLTTAETETIVDAQLSYDVSEVWIDGLSFYLQGSNLTNEPFIQYLDGNSAKIKNYHTYGTSYMLGFTYKR
jgi:iron complex outermembrane receptor protein